MQKEEMPPCRAYDFSEQNPFDHGSKPERGSCLESRGAWPPYAV